MIRRSRKTLVSLDSGTWCFARLVGPGYRASGVRVQPSRHPAKGKPIFTVAAPNSGVGFAL
ncbi:hypothetical protein C8K36_1011116 [Rhodococcus sp. OK519]|uniref:enoyl-CoA hydratase n=1 Tax=Rhodococcus sp. OK519 TaxID=2135729 RepID=UPI000D3CD79A|nr:hypothetical protein C8K36_1011116 [Rhodococcus sp. OK519]